MVRVMASDQATFQRGTSAAVLGLVIQAALTVTMGLIGLWAQSPAAYAATWHFAAGLPIWIVLALYYNQRRIERREALASERMISQGGAAAEIFGGLSDELQLSQQRVEKLLKYGFPIVSFSVAIYLLAAGAGLLWSHLARTAAGEALPLSPTCNTVALMFATGAVAFLAFVSARWVSGLTRVPAWQMLRGGASYLMSSFVLAGLLFAGAAVASVVSDTSFFGWLAVAVPIAMMLVGGEILLTSLLAAYRPRRPGELPRPAFDSRVLGLLTAPESLGTVIGDLVNYQFGVEISKSWVYEMLGRAAAPLAILGGLLMAALSMLVVVGPDEQGVVMRFGALRGVAIGPGLHVKLPWPIETSMKYPVGRVLQIIVSSDLTGMRQPGDAILWTTGDDQSAKFGMEYYLTAPGRIAGDVASGGMSLVAAEIIVQYRVADLVHFLSGSLSPKEAITAVTQQEANRYFCGTDIDTLLSRGRTEGGGELERRIQARLDSLDLGLEVVGVSITSLHPPIGAVSRKFHEQIGAQQSRETMVEKAKKDAVVTLAKVAGSVEQAEAINEQLLSLDTMRGQGDAPASPATTADRDTITAREQDVEQMLSAARGEAAEVIHAARSYRWNRSVAEKASLDRFQGELLAFTMAPDYYRTKRFLEVLAEGLSKSRKFVIAGEGINLPTLDMDFNDPTSAIDTLLAE
jgi:regulator of protease activity HflC (stomatin/prohibitin superfamily)